LSAPANFESFPNIDTWAPAEPTQNDKATITENIERTIYAS